jgi:hypothetical protein
MAHPSSRARAIAARLLCAVVLSSCAHDVAGPARPTQLAFTTQPGTVVAGHAFNTAPRVEAEDANGHKVGSFTGNVTVALAHNPGGSTLAGTTTVAAVDGIATFDDLSLDKAGTGYTLTAAAAGEGLAVPTSAPFDVAAGPATHLRFTVQPTTVVAGAALAPPLQVTALDPEGNAAASFTGNVTVAFGGSSGTGSTLGGTTKVAAVNGVASFVDLTISKTGTGYWLTASATGLAGAASRAFEVTAGTATQLVFGTEPGTTVADHAITPAVKVRALDALGNLVPSFAGNVSIASGNNPGGATLSGTTPVAAVGGVATFFDLTLNRTGTGYTLTASASGFAPVTSIAFDITPGTATQLAFTSQPTNAVAGASIGPVVQVTALDPAGNPVPGFTGSVTVAFGNNPGGSTLSGTTTVTAVNGVASFGDLSANKTGTSYWLTASAIGLDLSRATSSVFAITPGPATQLAFGTQPSTTVADHQISPAVKVRALDAYGNLATGFSNPVTVALGSNPGGATLGGATPVSAVSGVATFFDVSLNKTGTGYTLTASASGLAPVTSTTFDIVPGTASQLAFTQQPSITVAGAAISPAVQVTALDPAGNPVPGFTASVTIALGNNPGGSTLGGTTTLAAVNGVASFSTLTLDKTGTGYWLRATATGLSTATSSAFTITAGAATQLVFGTQPGTTVANRVIAPAVKVRALDALGNLVPSFTGSVTIAVGSNPGGATLSGTTPVSAASGVATFFDLSLNKTGTGYTLTASGSGFTTVTSTAFDIIPGTATQLAFTVQPSTTVAGAAISPAVQVTALDPAGNLVPGFTGSITVALGNNPGGSTLGGTTTVAAVNGVASFSTLTLDKTGTGYWLSATASGLNTGTSSAFTITAGAATQLVFGTQPGTTVANRLMTPAVKVRALDALGNLVPSFTGSVAIALGNNPGGATLSGTTPVSAASGVATFFDLSLNKTGMGYTLAASASGLGPVTSTAFDITPGPASQLAFTVQPLNTVAGAAISPAVQVTALDPAGNLVPGFTGDVTLSLGTNPGGSTLGGTTTVAALNGVASFSTLTLDKTGTGYRLTGTASGLSTATSSAFNITAGPATQLVFSTQPSTTVADHQISPAVKVRALDGFGNVATGFSGAVAVALGNNPGGSTLSGTTPVAAVSGVATFFLSLDKTGTAYTLTASAGGLGQVTSAAFDIIPGTATQLTFSRQPGTTVAGAAISPAVQVTALDPAGNPVPGFTGNVTVAFGNNPGGSTLGGTTTVAAVSGVATFGDLSANRTSTGYWLRATATGMSAATSSDFAIISGPATQLVFGTQPSTTVAANLITPAVKVRALDALGNVATDFNDPVAVALGNNPGGATLSGTTPVAAANGIAAFFLSLDKVGTGYTLAASAGGLSPGTSIAFDVIPGTATHLAFTQQPSTTVAGAVITPAVQVTALDPAGNPVPSFTGDVTVALGNNSGGGTLGGTTTVAAVNGVASFSTLTLDKTGTSYWLAVTATGFSTTTSSVFAITPGVATHLVFGTQPSTTVADNAITPAVKVRALDALGNLATGYGSAVAIALGNNPGGATLSGTKSVAAVSGVATFFDLGLNKTGTDYTLRASATGFASVASTAFDITPGTATQLAFTVQPSSTVAGAAISPAVLVTALDPAGNPAPDFTGDVTVTFGNNPGGSTLGGTTTVAAVNGVARFWDLSANKTGTGYWLRATATRLNAATSSVFSVTPGAATQLVFSQQPGTITGGTIFNPAVKVRALDALGNLATSFTGDVTMELGVNPGGRPLDGTTTVTAVGGVATFFALSVARANTGYTLIASAAGLPGVESVPFDVRIGPASHLDFQTRPHDEIAGGIIGDPYVQLRGEDAGGNLDTTFTGLVTVVIGDNPGGGTLSGTTSATAVRGLATFPNLTIDKVATGYTLTFSSTGLLGVTSLTFTITPAAASQLVFTVQPTTTVAGDTITPAVEVTARDAFGNVATGFAGAVTLAIGSNPGGATLGGTTTVTAAAGVASLGTLSINKAGVGYTLVAGSGGLTGATSVTFDIN